MHLQLTLTKITVHLLLISALASVGCKNKTSSFVTNDNLVVPLRKEFVDVKAYPSFIAKVREQNGKKINDPVALKKHFIQTLSTGIPTFWIGTKWDFNGVTRTPQSGAIACGYFITNTLTDVGIPLERIKLAQVASSVMIKQICVKTKHLPTVDALIKYTHDFPADAVFVAGLDFHTGYIIKEHNELYFLHSNYIGRAGVIKEKIGSSVAFKNSKSYTIGCLSENAALLKKLRSN